MYENMRGFVTTITTTFVGLPILIVLHHVSTPLIKAEIIGRQHHLDFVLMVFLWVGV